MNEPKLIPLRNAAADALLEVLRGDTSYRRAETTTTVEAVGGLEDNGTLEAWETRHRNPNQFREGTRVRTSPKRAEDPIEYGTTLDDPTNEGGNWTVHVTWDGAWRSSLLPGTDLRSLIPLETY